MTREYLLRELIGRTVVRLSRVVLIDEDIQTVLDNTLLFALSDGGKRELYIDMEEQAVVPLRVIDTGESLVAGFPLDPGESISPVEIAAKEFGLALPFTVSSITETWSDYDDYQALVAATLWNKDQEPVLSIVTETDEIEILTLAELESRLSIIDFPYKTFLYDQ